MATSDNVVRAGLTPKWKDVDTLCRMLTYKDGAPHVVEPTQVEGEPHIWSAAAIEPYEPTRSPAHDCAKRRVHVHSDPPAAVHTSRRHYVPPPETDEFVLERIEFGANEASPTAPATLRASAGLSILIVVTGNATVEQLDDATTDEVGLQRQVGAASLLANGHAVLAAPASALPSARRKSPSRPVRPHDLPAERPLLWTRPRWAAAMCTSSARTPCCGFGRRAGGCWLTARRGSRMSRSSTRPSTPHCAA